MKLLIVHRKHEDRYFLFRTEEEFEQVCLDVMTEADEMGYFFEPPADSPEEPEKPDPMPEWAEAAYERALASYKRKLQRHREETHQWELVERVRDGDEKAARDLMMLRQHCEYEEWEIQTIAEPAFDDYRKYTAAVWDTRYFEILRRIIEDRDESAFDDIKTLEKELDVIVHDKDEVEGPHYPNWDEDYSAPNSDFMFYNYLGIVTSRSAFSRGMRVIRHLVHLMKRHYNRGGLEKTLDRASFWLRNHYVKERMSMLGLSLDINLDGREK